MSIVVLVPFGAVIVKDNQIISEGFNTVTLSNDPTSHAEIAAIRTACKNLGNFSLKDCDCIQLANHAQCVYLLFIGPE